MEMAEENDTLQSLITEKEIKTALLTDKGKEASFKSYRIVDFTKPGDHHESAITSIEVTYSEDSSDHEVSYVVKLNPGNDVDEFAEITNVIFLKEAKFLMEVVPELNAALGVCGEEPLRFPRCFHTVLEPQKEQIYLEDLRVRGFKLFNRNKGMDENHATLVLKELARLHAASCIVQAKHPTDPLEVRYDFLLKNWFNFTETSKDIMITMISGYLSNSAEFLRIIEYDERVITWIESLVPEIEDLINTEMATGVFGTICHGDCWNNNMLFRYNENEEPLEVMMIDFQLCHMASIASDLNYFLYTSLTGSVRTSNLTNFLSTYHATYKGVLEGGLKSMKFTEEELTSEFRDKNTLGAIFGMVVLQMVLLENEELPDIADYSTLEEVENAVKATAMDVMESNPTLKTRFLAIFDELIETGLIH